MVNTFGFEPKDISSILISPILIYYTEDIKKCLTVYFYIV
jgi:hypothetical protein